MAAAVYTGEWPCACAIQDRENDGVPPDQQKIRRHASTGQYPWAERNGCRKDATKVVGTLDGRPMFRCLAALVTERQPDAWDLLRLHRRSEQGHLPESGGTMEQASPVMDALDVLDSAVAKSRETETPKPSADGGLGQRTERGYRARNPVRNSLKPRRT